VAEVAYVKTESDHETYHRPRPQPDGSEKLVQVSPDVDAPLTLEREVRVLNEGAFPHASLHRVILAHQAGRISMPGNIAVAEASQ
jgi:hypothetical protein